MQLSGKPRTRLKRARSGRLGDQSRAGREPRGKREALAAARRSGAPRRPASPAPIVAAPRKPPSAPVEMLAVRQRSEEQ